MPATGNPPDFAPDDPTDGRALGSFTSRYPPEAQRQIRSEAIYSGVMLLIFSSLLAYVWYFIKHPQPYLAPADAAAFLRYACAWLGGSMAGSVYSIKWLYHSVARNIWNEDRLYWRIFTPHLSGVVAFFMLAFLSSRILQLIDYNAVQHPSACLAMGFLVGYFSDNAIAKLAELAETLFGTVKKTKPKPADKREPEDGTTV
jgi:hypothetical protein